MGGGNKVIEEERAEWVLKFKPQKATGSQRLFG